MKLVEYLSESRVTQQEFAQALGVTQGLVGFWLRGKPPTPQRAVQIERITGGKVGRRDLRDDWQDIWPELAAAAAPPPAAAPRQNHAAPVAAQGVEAEA